MAEAAPVAAAEAAGAGAERAGVHIALPYPRCPSAAAVPLHPQHHRYPPPPRHPTPNGHRGHRYRDRQPSVVNQHLLTAVSSLPELASTARYRNKCKKISGRRFGKLSTASVDNLVVVFFDVVVSDFLKTLSVLFLTPPLLLLLVPPPLTSRSDPDKKLIRRGPPNRRRFDYARTLRSETKKYII